jgi:IS5 family transposase
MMLRMCVLQSLYNLSDEETEWQSTDRLSFRQFLGLGSADRVPDARTLWVFKERLGETGVKALFTAFLQQMRQRGLKHREGKIVDATIMEVPRQRNRRDENDQIKQGQRPASFDENPARGRQKDTDARWTRKHQRNYYGYKNHTKVDATSKIIEDYAATDASVHDSQVIAGLMGKKDGFVFADGAYDGKPVANQLQDVGVESYIHTKACRGRKLSAAQRDINKDKSRIRARVEHVYGWMFRKGKLIIRSIGMARAQRCIGMANLVYNMDRFAFLTRRAG